MRVQVQRPTDVILEVEAMRRRWSIAAFARFHPPDTVANRVITMVRAGWISMGQA